MRASLEKVLFSFLAAAMLLGSFLIPTSANEGLKPASRDIKNIYQHGFVHYDSVCVFWTHNDPHSSCNGVVNTGTFVFVMYQYTPNGRKRCEILKNYLRPHADNGYAGSSWWINGAWVW